jgi:multiple sugar transport system substrate-binding protein
MSLSPNRLAAGRRSRRRLLGAALAAGAPVALAACGATGQGTTPEASQSRAPVTLEHVDWWGPTTPVLTTFFDGIKKDFEAKSPNVTVNYTFVQGGTTGVREKWVVNTAGGTPHDSSQVSVAFIRELMDGNLMEPLDPYIQKAPGMALSNFVDSGLFYNTFQGKHYGLPFDGPSMNVIAYNTDHFRDAGLDPSQKFTWSWTVDQFLDAARRLTKTEGQRVLRGGFATRTGTPLSLSVANLLPWLYAFGGEFYSPDYTKTLVNDQKGRGALQLLYDLRNRHKVSPDIDGATFEGETVSMAFAGSWEVGYLLDKNPALKFGFAPMPAGPQATKGPSTQTWTNQWTMTRSGKHKDAAWDWISFVNSSPVQEQYFATVMKRFSGRKSVYTSQAWKNVVKDWPALEGIEKMEPLSKQYPWVKTTPINEQTADIWKKAQANEIGVNEALSQVEQIVNRVLAGG